MRLCHNRHSQTISVKLGWQLVNCAWLGQWIGIVDLHSGLQFQAARRVGVMHRLSHNRNMTPVPSSERHFRWEGVGRTDGLMTCIGRLFLLPLRLPLVRSILFSEQNASFRHSCHQTPYDIHMALSIPQDRSSCCLYSLITLHWPASKLHDYSHNSQILVKLHTCS